MADNQKSYEADAEAEALKSVVHKVRDADDHVCIETTISVFSDICLGLHGISILEVYSITYLGSYPLEAEDQIGIISIKTNDILYHLYLEYKVDTSKPSIEYGDQLPMLNGGGGPICNFTRLELNFDSFSDEYEGSPKVFSHSPNDGDLLAKLSMRSIDGYERKISVLFGCFSNATVANLEVMLLPHVTSSDDTTDVYGDVVASNSKFNHPSCTSYLFSRKPASAIQVEHNDVIPLSKSRVGVPLDSQLNVDLSLFCDDIQHKGIVDFIPKINGDDSQMVGNRILVKVTWNCNEDSNSTDEDSDFTDEDSYFTDEDSGFMDEFYFASECEYDSDGFIQEEILKTIT